MSRQVVEEVLGKKDTKELWASGYRPALPVTPQDFTLGSVLPAVLYMMRWGQRRGKGKFFDQYGKQATVNEVANRLGEKAEIFRGFEGEAQQAILADLLLAYCLENKGHRLGREEQVQRVFPTHYFSSWVDLPKDIANLRNVPEMIVAILARQQEGAVLSRDDTSGHFAIGSEFESNLLLSIFGPGTRVEGHHDNVRGDKFEENTPVGIDQLLAVRLAQSLGEAPIKARGENPNIPNQWPVAIKAADTFFEDFNVFLRSYGHHIPRQSLLPMLESCLAVGGVNIYLSTLKILLNWSTTGVVLPKADQSPWPLFVDCSASVDATLRRFSEENVDDLVQRLSRMAISMMCLRVLDQWAQQERSKNLPAATPNPTARINFLGDLLFGRHEESRDLERDLRRKCNKLSDTLEASGEVQAKMILDNDDVHPAWRLAEALVFLMGDKLQGAQFRKYFDSCLMVDQPNGLGRKRRSILKGKSVERRSIVLTNTAIDFLVHRHLRKSKKGTGPADLSLAGFISILRERYGLHIDEAPQGMSIPSEQLRKNRNFLERRLRDLGLFIGVNDAEAMKRLRQRFEVDDGDE
jgi:hypothetical protein